MAQAARRIEPDTEAEYALLGIGLADPQMWPSILARVSPEDCGSLYVQRLLRFVQENAARGVLVGLAEMASQVEPGERQHLIELRSQSPDPSRLGYWCDRVRERAGRTRLHSLAWHMRNLTLEERTPVAEIAASVSRELAEIVSPGVAAKVLSPVEWLERWERETERRRELAEQGRLALPTGIPTLDNDVMVEPGHMVLVAAATGVGKTAFGLSVARAASVGGATVLYANTEMEIEAMVTRVLSAETGESTAELRRGFLSEAQWKRVRAAMQRLRDNGRLHITEPLAGTDPEAIAHLARAYKAERGLDVLVVDYIGRLDIAPEKGEREWNVLERTAARMKALAVELRCAVYLLVQRTEDGTIAGSRRMRNDADLVLEIVPVDEDDERTRRRFPHATHLIAITKARHAKGGRPIGVQFDAARMTWTEVAGA